MTSEVEDLLTKDIEKVEINKICGSSFLLFPQFFFFFFFFSFFINNITFFFFFFSKLFLENMNLYLDTSGYDGHKTNKFKEV